MEEHMEEMVSINDEENSNLMGQVLIDYVCDESIKWSIDGGSWN